MGKLWATIRYGSAKTRAFLGVVFVLLLAGAILAVYGFMTYTLWALAGGAVGLIAGLVMIFMANFATEDIDASEGDEDEDDEDSAKAKRQKRSVSDDIDDITDDNTDADEEYNFGVIDLPKNDEKTSGKRDKDGKSDKNGKYDEDAEPAGKAYEVPYNIREYVVTRYSPEEFRRTLRRYKVKRHFIPIIIDEAPSFNTIHTPTLLWVKHDTVNFLLLEGNERVVTMPMNAFLNVHYEHDVPENRPEDYDKIREEIGIFDQFEDVMPSFTTSVNRMGITSAVKNRYVLGRDVAITPASLRALREKFKFNMNIFDSLKLNGEYSIYFKRAYETRILWTDKVIGQQDYQTRISNILQTMVDDRNLIRYDFLDDLERMVQYRLITNEYADYYNALRRKKEQTRDK